MKLTVILNAKGKEIYLDNKWYKIGVPVEMELSSILRHRRYVGIEFPDIPRAIYDKTLWKKDKIFGLTGDADVLSGFGNCTVNLLKYSTEKGYDVRWIGKNTNVSEIRKFAMKELPQEMAMVWHEQPKKEWDRSPFAKNIALVPFETTRIPPTWVPRINRMDALLAISDQNIQMFRDSGVKIPISKVKWGIDEKKFDYIERTKDDFFTFGCCGALSERKGTDVLVKAFQIAFPKWQYPKVRLLLKSSHNMFKWGVKGDERIVINLNPVAHEEFINQFWKKIDVFCWPTRGEGWGLPLHECLAMGIPAIATNWGGTKEIVTPETCLLMDNYKMVPAKDFSEKLYHEDCGNWCEPDVQELVNYMRHAYLNQDDMKEMAKRGHDHIFKNLLWSQVIKDFTGALDKYL